VTNEYVGSAYCRAEIYAGRVACCPHYEYADNGDKTDRQTDTRPLYYAFRKTGQEITVIICTKPQVFPML